MSNITKTETPTFQELLLACKEAKIKLEPAHHKFFDEHSETEELVNNLQGKVSALRSCQHDDASTEALVSAVAELAQAENKLKLIASRNNDTNHKEWMKALQEHSLASKALKERIFARTDF